MKTMSLMLAIKMVANRMQRHGLPWHSPPGRGRCVNQQRSDHDATRTSLVIVASAALLLAGCGGADTAPVPDLIPIGEGLKVIAYAIIAAAVIVTLGKILH